MTTLDLGRDGSALVVRTLPAPVELRTRRLWLRAFKDTDLPAWSAMNADPEVRRHFASVLSDGESRAEADRIQAALAARGWGLWALEVPGVLPFAGIVGLHVPMFEAGFMPAVEMGWRLSRDAWGQGYASEAAAAAAAFAFGPLGLPGLVAYTAVSNEPSQRVMRRLGMWHDAAFDFDHPRIEAGHPLRRQLLWRLDAARFALRG